MTILRTAVAALVLGVCCAVGLAQTSTPRFEVASVRPQEGALPFFSPGGPRLRPGGTFAAAATTVAELIKYAYNVPQVLIADGPDWVRSDRFAISAKAPAEATVEQVRLMVRSLLADRFSLSVHVEPRDMRAYALVLSRPDGQPGPYLRPGGDACDGAEVRKEFPPRGDLPRGGTVMSGSCGELARLAEWMTIIDEVGAPVIDRTALGGSWVYQVYYKSSAVTLRARGFDEDPDLPPLHLALEEQLGLQLQPVRGPVDVLVIDSVQRPSEN